jgi:hypothetical protein
MLLLILGDTVRKRKQMGYVSPEVEAQKQQQIDNERKAKINTLLSVATDKLAAYQDMIDFAGIEEETMEAQKGLFA